MAAINRSQSNRKAMVDKSSSNIRAVTSSFHSITGNYVCQTLLSYNLRRLDEDAARCLDFYLLRIDSSLEDDSKHFDEGINDDNSYFSPYLDMTIQKDSYQATVPSERRGRREKYHTLILSWPLEAEIGSSSMTCLIT